MEMDTAFGIVCFGRGIERVRLVGWRPTAYLEKMTQDWQHSGHRVEGLQLDCCDDDHVVIAGGHANAMATAQLFRDCANQNNLPKLIAWAAGRPRYLENGPADVSEGSVLFAEFKEEIGEDYAGRFASVRLEFQAQNRNTRDDLLQSLATAHDMGLERMVVVSVLVHLQRINAFLAHALREAPQFAKIKVELVASDVLLRTRQFSGGIKCALALDDPGLESVNHLALAQIIESPVYRRTAAREAKGTADLRAGRYNFGHQGYQFGK
jgi:hypothetical protein